MSRRHANRRLHGDGGAVIVEFALILPVLALFVCGVIDYGLLWRSGTVVERATSAGGRSGSSLADNRFADYQLLQVINSALSSTPDIEIERVVVFRSTTTEGEVPAACLGISATGTGSKGVSGLCNVYSAAQATATDLAGWGGSTTCAGGAWDSSWCPTSRNRDRPGADYLGVYVEVTRPTVTGFFTNEFTISRTAVFLLEPDNVGA